MFQKSECEAEAQAQRRQTQSASLGSGSDTFMVESVSEIAGAVGEEEGELPVNAVLCLRHYLLEKV